MKGHNYGQCRKCGKFHKHPRGTLGKFGITAPKEPAHLLWDSNPQFKHGLWSMKVKVHFKGKHQVCMECGQKKPLEIHHKDGDPTNNDLDNLLVLCRKCHMKLDGRLENRGPSGKFTGRE